MKNLVTYECYQGWNQLDFINFSMIFLWSMLFIICTFIWVLILIVIVPLSICTYYSVTEMATKLKIKQEEQSQRIIKQLVKKQYSCKQFTFQKQCPICMSDFENEHQVTPLPCNVKHYFHTECISVWIKAKPERLVCPICRTEIQIELLIQF